MDHRLVFLLIVLNSCASSFGSNDSAIVVEVKQGKVLGTILKSRDGRDFYSFLGIPYAQAERFQVICE